jgi:hypothetical protein
MRERYFEIKNNYSGYKVAEAQKVEEQETVDSTSDQRTVNNVMRHAYRVLTDAEKARMKEIKDAGLAFVELLDTVGKELSEKRFGVTVFETHGMAMAKDKVQEAVFWAVYELTK